MRRRPSYIVGRDAVTDLVIGSRRPNPPRPWRAGAIALAMVGVAIVVTWFIYRRSVAYDIPPGEVHGELAWRRDASTAPRLMFNGSTLEWLGGLPVLHLNGDAHAIGAAHGRLLAPLLAAVVRAHAPSIEGTVADDGWLGGATHDIRLSWRWRFLDDGVAEADRRMTGGLVRGAAASGVAVGFDDALRDQAVLDVGSPAPTSGEGDARSLAHSLAIVVDQAVSPGHVWIARTFALPGLDDGGDAELPVVSITHAEGHIAYAAVGWPGLLGVVTGVNARGIAVMVAPARTADVRAGRGARPVAMLARSVLEQADSLDAAVKLIEGTPTLGAAAFLVVEGDTGKRAIVERTPSKAIVERSPRSPALGDVLTTNALAQDPDNDRARRLLATQARVERAARLARAPAADVATVAAMLRDQRATDDTPRPSGHRGAIDDGRAVHAVILDPGTLELWVADPRASGRMRGFDLRHELRGDGDHAAPPPDIPADTGADRIDRDALVAARAELRAARSELGHGDRERAAEAVSRARVRVPGLPEAVELDAAIAQARGDDARAKRLYQEWLDAGPDDPEGEERARAVLAR
jgi:isopenicillin-N N-acyltransferase-like protein